jgi:TPR repeat protein
MRYYLMVLIFFYFTNSYSSKESECSDAESISKQYEICLPLAEQGNAKAQYIIGTMFDEYGLAGISKNYPEAYRWYKLSANQGFTKAQIKLGDVYIYGRNVQQDINEAYKWYLLAAEKNDAKAQEKIGKMYSGNRHWGFKANYDEALKWFLLAAQQGNKDAQFELGKLYENNKNNYVEAIKWYKLASENDVEEAQLYLGYIYLNKIKDLNEAKNWFKLAAKKSAYDTVTSIELNKIEKKLNNNAQIQKKIINHKQTEKAPKNITNDNKSKSLIIKYDENGNMVQ